MELRGFYTGFKAAIIASSCCTFPLALVLLFSTLGAGSMTAALKIPRYKVYFIAVGSIFLLISLYLTIKRKCGGTCTLKDVNHERNLVVMSIATYVIMTFLIIYLLLPAISGWLFGG